MSTTIDVRVVKEGKVGFDVGIEISLRDTAGGAAFFVYPIQWLKRGQAFELEVEAEITRPSGGGAPSPFMLRGIE